MAKTDFKSVAEYLDTLPKEARKTLERVRAVLRKAVPAAEEVISYQIPTLKLEGAAVVYFAAWKAHYSLYPATKGVVSTLEAELVGYEVRKGTIAFPLSEPVPTKLITAIAKLRAQETAALLAERQAKRGRVAKKSKATSKAKKTPKLVKASKAQKPSKAKKRSARTKAQA
jgi:uncharacterized protein YdhG (YjbR/CyaY superfamily)